MAGNGRRTGRQGDATRDYLSQNSDCWSGHGDESGQPWIPEMCGDTQRIDRAQNVCGVLQWRAKRIPLRLDGVISIVSCRLEPAVLVLINNKKSALPGNRTRVARMGILHDTTTPAVLTCK